MKYFPVALRILVATACLGAVPLLNADVIVAWNNSSDGGETSGSVATLADHLTLTNTWSRNGTNAIATGNTVIFNSNTWGTGGNFALGRYNYFTITVEEGYTLDLDTFNLKTRPTNGSGPTEWQVRSSIDDYATILHSFTSTGSGAQQAIALSGAFDTITDSIQFRVYGSTTGSSGAQGAIVQDTNLVGTVIPESSTWAALLGMAVLGLAQLSRSRRAGREQA